jgi:hypothetical protein
MANYSKKAVFGFVCIVVIIALMAIFAILKPAIIYDTLGGYLFLIIILICITSLILSILAIIECRKDKELKGIYLSIATIVILLLFVIFIFERIAWSPAPSPNPSCQVKGGICQSACDTDQQPIDGTCKINQVCCSVISTG